MLIYFIKLLRCAVIEFFDQYIVSMFFAYIAFCSQGFSELIESQFYLRGTSLIDTTIFIIASKSFTESWSISSGVRLVIASMR